MTHFSELTEDEFDTRYPLLVNHLNPSAGWVFDNEGGCLFETFGPEFEFVRQQDSQRVWTLVDADDGHLAVISGLHYVNRIGYLISQAAFPLDEQVTVRIACKDIEGGAAMTNSSEMTNLQRAARAERILKRYQTGNDDLQTGLADVLTDAMHWCDSTGFDFPSICDQAYRYYIEELGEQPVVRDVPQSLTSDIHRLLATRRQIAHIWSIEDVQSQCDWLTDEQAWEVLQSVKRHSDACIGINWNVIDQVAHDLYPQSPSTHSKGN